MKLLSLNVGLPRLISWQGRTIHTAIFKEPVARRVVLRQLNLDGDRQADLTVHGGPYKAVYAYPSEHYPFWREELPDMQLPYGKFGENFTTEGLLETDVRIGDRYRIGSAIIQVRQPRTPCYKLSAKFQREDMLKRFLASGRSGFYFSVDQEGEVGAGDEFDLFSRDDASLTVAEINHLYGNPEADPELLKQAANLAALPESWRRYFQSKVEERSSVLPAS